MKVKELVATLEECDEESEVKVYQKNYDKAFKILSIEAQEGIVYLDIDFFN
jgi:hypothetical protein